MADAKLIPRFKERTFIKKYAEGVDPAVGSPFETTEGPEKFYEGQEAIKRLKELGYDVSAFNIKEV